MPSRILACFPRCSCQLRAILAGKRMRPIARGGRESPSGRGALPGEGSFPSRLPPEMSSRNLPQRLGPGSGGRRTALHSCGGGAARSLSRRSPHSSLNYYLFSLPSSVRWQTWRFHGMRVRSAWSVGQ